MGSIPGLGRSPGGGHGNPLQYSCLENPTDRGAWWATVHCVKKSWTRRRDEYFHFSFYLSRKLNIFKCFAKSLESCPTLQDLVDCSPPGSSVCGILQERILEWVAMPSSRGIFLNQGIKPVSLMSSALAGRFFTASATWEAPITKNT